MCRSHTTSVGLPGTNDVDRALGIVGFADHFEARAELRPKTRANERVIVGQDCSYVVLSAWFGLRLHRLTSVPLSGELVMVA